MDSCLYGYGFAHHRLTQIFTELYFSDFKLIKLCENLC